jgi:hypothetical protein
MVGSTTKRIGMIGYKSLYCGILALMMIIALEGVPFGNAPSILSALLMWIYVAGIVVTGVTAIALQRCSKRRVWGIVIFFCAIFSWQGWWGPGGLFVQTEAHSFDSVAAERARFYHQSIALYVLMIAWFLTLPIIHHFVHRNARGLPSA